MATISATPPLWMAAGQTSAAASPASMDLKIKRCRPARFQSIFPRSEWSILQVDVEIINTGSQPLRVPRGEQVVLADGVGYAYRDERRTLRNVVVPPGARRDVQYLFKIPQRSLIGKLIVRDKAGLQLAGTGFVDIRVSNDAGV